MSKHTPTPEIFGPDPRQLAFVYNAYRSYASYVDRVTGRFFAVDYSTPEQRARRAALAKVDA